MTDFLHIGHCSCPQEFARCLSVVTEQIPLYISIPMLTPRLENTWKILLELISARQDVVLAINDWGTLFKCSQMKKQGLLKPALAAGVLLAGQDTDPLLLSFEQEQSSRIVMFKDRITRLIWTPPSQNMKRHWQTPSIFNLIPMLTQLGITRIELCTQPFPFPEKALDIPVTLYSEALISVFPCKQNCTMCMAKTEKRNGITLFRSRNLLLAKMPPMPLASWFKNHKLFMKGTFT